MGETTICRVAEQTLLPMFSAMTCIAQGETVGDLESQTRVRRKWLNVMGPKIPSTRITAPLAREMITCKYVESPSLVSLTEALSASFDNPSVFVGGAVAPTQGATANRRADLHSLFDGPRLFKVSIFAPLLSTHSSRYLRSVLDALSRMHQVWVREPRRPHALHRLTSAHC